MITFRHGLCLLGLLFLSASFPSAVQAQEDFRPRQVIPRPFPAITDFAVATLDQAADAIGDSELVLGVVVGGKARAYPINMLTGPQREILNDTLADQPIAATW